MQKKFYKQLIFISCIAFIIRLIVSYQLLQHDPQVAHPSSGTDMATYVKYAKQCLSGTYSGVLYYQPFYYIVFLPTIYFVSGSSIFFFITIQSILGAFTVFLSGLSGAIIRGKSTGLIAAVIVTLSTTLIFMTPYKLIATLQTFWVVLLLYLALIALKKQTLKQWSLIGIVTGCAILTRGNIWFFTPILLFISMNIRKDSTNDEHKTQWTFSKKNPIIFILLLILVQLPFIIYNSRVTHKLTGPSTAAGAVLALGNTPEAPPGGRDPGTGAGPMSYPPTYTYWMKKQKDISIFNRIMEWFYQQPAAFIELQCRKLLLFWNYKTIPNNIALETQGKQSSYLALLCRAGTPLQPLGILATSYIILFGLAGMFITFPHLKKHRFLLLTYFIVAYWLATAAFYILERFRAPILPILAIFAAIFITTSYQKYKKQKKNILLKHHAPALFFALFITFLSFSLYRTSYETTIMHFCRPNGTITKISDNTLSIADNGPQPFGGWTPLQSNITTLTKKFKTSPTSKNNTLQLTLYWEEPGEYTIKLNGTPQHLNVTKRGATTHTFKNVFGTQFTIQLMNPKGHFIIDTQRFYKRTLLPDNTPIYGELVSTLLCTTSK